MSIESSPVATVKAIYRYPVKSMQGEALQATHVGWHGLDGDRRYAFVRAENRSNFPWLTGRQVADMLRYVPRFSDSAQPDKSPVVVTSPDGREMPVESQALLDELSSLYGSEVHRLRDGRGLFDESDLSLLSLNSVQALSAETGAELTPLRFRANLVVEALSGQPFAEDAWVGRRLTIGAGPEAVKAWMSMLDVRCMMINLDPETAQQNPAVLRQAVARHNKCVGIYGTIEQPGHIKVGDTVYLTEL